MQTIEVRVCAIENCVEIKATYLENSQSQGVLIFLLPQGNRREEETDLRKAVYMLLNKNDIDGHFYQISGVSRGNYKVLVYNIESDGSLRPGGPATSARVNVTSGSTTGIMNPALCVFSWDLDCVISFVDGETIRL